MIALTDTATTKVKELLEAEDQPELSLRVAVRPGGCSGLSYEMFFDSEKAADDIDRGLRRGVQVVVDPASAAVPRRRVARLQGRPPGRRVHDQQPERAAHLRLRPVVLLTFRREADASWRSPRSRLRSSVTVARSSSTRPADESLLLRAARAARHRLGQGRLRAAGSVRLLHGARRRRAARRVRHAGRAGRRPRRSRRSKASTPDARDRLAAAFVATGGSQCGFCTPGIIMRVVGRARPRSSTARSPRTCAAAPAGCTVYDALAAGRRGDARARDLDARGAARARSKAACRKRVGVDVPLGGAPFADDTAPRDALVAVPLPPGSAADVRRGGRAALGRRRVAGRSARPRPARCRAGARPSRSVRRCSIGWPRCPPGGVRLATSWVEPAYLEPDASWCAPGRRARVAARERRRVRRQGRTRPRRARRASSPIGSAARCASCTRAKTSCGSARSARRSRRPRVFARRRVEIDGVVARRCAPRSPRVADAVRVSRSTRVGREVDVAGPAGRRRAARGRARRAGGARRGRARRGRRRPRDAHRRSDAARHVRGRAVGRERGRARARRRRDRRARRASRCASRPAIRSTRSCCARTRSARRTWRSGGCCTESLAVDPDDRRGARPHDPLVRHHPRRRTCRRSTSRSSPTTARRSRGRPTRCSPRSPPRRGTRSLAPRARGPIRSRRGRRAPRVDSGGSDARRTRSDPERTARRRARTHPPCAPATGSCSPARSGSIPRPARSSRRRRGAGPPGAREHHGGARRLRRVAAPTSPRRRCSSPTSASSRP